MARLEIFRFAGDFDAGSDELAHLFVQMLQVDDHTVAHDVDYLRAQDTGWHQVQNKFTQMVDDGVTRIVAALVADNHIIIFRKQVDHAALAFVSPVNTNDCA